MIRHKIITCILEKRKLWRNLHEVCPFATQWLRTMTCKESCGFIFPEWAEEVAFDEHGNTSAHPCVILGDSEVMATMQEKFPELYK